MSDSSIQPLVGSVTVGVTITNGYQMWTSIGWDAEENWSDWLMASNPQGAYPGHINKISCAGAMRQCLFAAGVNEQNGDWATASYNGHIGNLIVIGQAYSNTYASSKKITISDSAIFDFINNAVWINGRKVPNNLQ